MAGQTMTKPRGDKTQRYVFYLGLLLAGIAAIIVFVAVSGADVIDLYGIANFYIAGWDRCPPLNDGNCYGPVPDEGIVWGYLLLEEFGGSPAWQFDFSQTSNNPFAPIIVALVE